MNWKDELKKKSFQLAENSIELIKLSDAIPFIESLLEKQREAIKELNKNDSKIIIYQNPNNSYTIALNDYRIYGQKTELGSVIRLNANIDNKDIIDSILNAKLGG